MKKSKHLIYVKFMLYLLRKQEHIANIIIIFPTLNNTRVEREQGR